MVDDNENDKKDKSLENRVDMASKRESNQVIRANNHINFALYVLVTTWETSFDNQSYFEYTDESKFLITENLSEDACKLNCTELIGFI